jgi:hypothetical protein
MDHGGTRDSYRTMVGGHGLASPTFGSVVQTRYMPSTVRNWHLTRTASVRSIPQRYRPLSLVQAVHRRRVVGRPSGAARRGSRKNMNATASHPEKVRPVVDRPLHPSEIPVREVRVRRYWDAESGDARVRRGRSVVSAIVALRRPDGRRTTSNVRRRGHPVPSQRWTFQAAPNPCPCPVCIRCAAAVQAGCRLEARSR